MCSNRVRPHVRTWAHVRTLKNNLRTHLHARFWKFSRTYLHKNRRTRTCARARARTHTKGLKFSQILLGDKNATSLCSKNISTLIDTRMSASVKK